MILVTGADGFVGRSLCRTLSATGSPVRLAVRSLQGKDGINSLAGKWVETGNIGPKTDWHKALKGVDCVVHLAARVHVMKESASDPLAEFRRVNTAATERLARMAAQTGVRRLVFLSTIKVNGENTGNQAFTEADTPDPQDDYALSKWEAEQALKRVAVETGLDVVILRAPLVYGPGVKGNFLRLLQAVKSGIPLPLASVNNLRSLIFVENLVDAITTCMTHPQAVGKIYLLSDGEDVSTPDLILRLARALGRPAQLWPFPPALLRAAAGLLGKSNEAVKLLGSMQVDSTKIRSELGWKPPHSVDEGLAATARWFLAEPKAAAS